MIKKKYVKSDPRRTGALAERFSLLCTKSREPKVSHALIVYIQKIPNVKRFFKFSVQNVAFFRQDI
jgi:hypothetical protein